MHELLDIETEPETLAVPMTAEEFSHQSEFDPCELIRGKLVRLRHRKAGEGLLLSRLASLISGHVMEKSLGRILCGSGLFLEHDPDTVRGPDLHFIRTERWPGKIALDQYLSIAPDLCVEIISPNAKWSRVQRKIAEYRAFGVKLIWLIDLRTRGAAVFRADGTNAAIAKDGMLSGEDILPGFTLPLTELFAVLD